MKKIIQKFFANKKGKYYSILAVLFLCIAIISAYAVLGQNQSETEQASSDVIEQTGSSPPDPGSTETIVETAPLADQGFSLPVDQPIVETAPAETTTPTETQTSTDQNTTPVENTTAPTPETNTSTTNETAVIDNTTAAPTSNTTLQENTTQSTTPVTEPTTPENTTTPTVQQPQEEQLPLIQETNLTPTNTTTLTVTAPQEEVVEVTGEVFTGDAYKERFVQEGIVIWKDNLIGYENIYKTVRKTTVCGPLNTSCTPTEYFVQELDDTKQGQPIYKREGVDAYNLSGKIIKRHQENVGCFVCPTDNSKQVCYSYNDGFADNLNEKWQCECKSGTSCKVLDPISEEISYLRTDGDQI